MRRVLDASALLAYLQDERGADVVADAIADGVAMSSVNLAEVLSLAVGRGLDPADLFESLTVRGLLGAAITVEPFTTADSFQVARLRPLTRDHGLSLADRACLALAHRLDVPALTADTAWADVAVNVELTMIR